MSKKKVVLILALAIGVYIAMGIYADFSQLARVITGFEWAYLVALLGLTTAGYLLRYLKWDLFLKKAGVALPAKQNLFVFFSGLAMIVTPGKIGEIWKGWLIRDISGDSLNKTVPVVVLDRITDVLSLILLSAVGILSYREGVPLLAALLVCIAGFYVAVRSEPISARMLGVLERHAGKYAPDAKAMHTTFEQTMEPATLLGLSALNALAWFCECLGLYVVVMGFHEQISVTLATFIFSFASLAGGVSMIPGGIGLAEATITGFLQVYGLDAASAIGIALVVRFGTLWYGVLLGSAVYLAFRRKMIPPHDLRTNTPEITHGGI
ncbi:lysylphosphatidylglycerol synthase transmembrane domain-containing protein [Methanoculleus bourgensis]|jgi:uncharacterized protein (TIRG00374 family)|uniref:lysylphosphatidylglycerol synthase transmembrane domain-containing protein n=1 Tax=Methanoculleus bourgensis TaxID=83986 RepID=UPI002FDAA5C9|nr:lysylphosphatidylglycerol synthase transmembrane domain-containing protein [Verrucomicrobiota bacterium]